MPLHPWYDDVTSEDTKKLRLIRQCTDAAIDLATKRYAQMVMNLDEFTEEDLQEHLAILKRAAQFPEFNSKKTVAEVPTAKGEFPMVVQRVIDPFPAIATREVVQILVAAGFEITPDDEAHIEGPIIQACVRSRNLQKLADNANIEVWAP